VGDSVSQYKELHEGLLDMVQSEGPFDGLMGFSEGGAVAAFMLIEDARHHFADFKCGIFFSAAPPFDPDVVRNGVLRWIDPATDGILLTIPTAHIWSAVADVNSEKARSLSGICDDSVKEVFIHSLGHAVPGSKSEEALAGTLRVIEHTIENARARAD
jgi:hypothetical protein